MTPFAAWERRHGFKTAAATGAFLGLHEVSVKRLRSGAQEPTPMLLRLMELVDRHPEEGKLARSAGFEPIR